MNRNSSHSNENDISLINLEFKEKLMESGLDKMAEEKESKNAQSNGGLCSSPTDTKLTASDVTIKTKMANTLTTRRITIAGGFLDIALFSANCEQLKFVLELGNLHIYYHEVLGLIIASLVLQLLVGLTLFLMGCHGSKSGENEANILNHTTIGLVAIITIINIFINTFGPKGTVMARCLGAFAYANTKGPVWLSYLNHTWHYMNEDL